MSRGLPVTSIELGRLSTKYVNVGPCISLYLRTQEWKDQAQTIGFNPSAVRLTSQKLRIPMSRNGSDNGRSESLMLDENRSLSFTADSACISDARRRWELDQDNNEIRLQYSTVLAQSSSSQDNNEALLHLRYLLDESFSLRETLFYLSMLYYYQGNYAAARSYSEELYKIDPDSKQISNLHKAVCYKHKLSKAVAEKEQQEMAITVASVALGVVTVGLGILFSMKKK